MALIDVVRYEVNDRELVGKFSSEDLRIGTQLVVYNGQTAFFVKGGKVLDQFDAGTHTIKTHNIPLLNKLINLPFGGDSPFKAEVWYVNLLSILNGKWGTPTPIQLEDPKYEIIVPVRAFGQFGIKVTDPRTFLDNLVGNQASFSTTKLIEYFRGKIITFLTSLISQKMVRDNISILAINTYLNELSEYVCENLNPAFEKYGVSVENFYIMSINVPEDDPSLIKLKEAKDLAMKLKVAGRDAYQMERSFNVLEEAASNPSGGGNALNMGVGIGAGFGIGQMASNMVAQNMSTNIAPPPLPTNISYYIAINCQQAGPYDYNALSAMIANRQLSPDTLIWKQGMPTWSNISTVPEFASLFANTPPPIPMP